ncbi:MAG: hypothetical protein JWP78_1083 [Mucilaginibacter sp.]|nr:hypothetical protein [Mucilaginibacter sp.]
MLEEKFSNNSTFFVMLLYKQALLLSYGDVKVLSWPLFYGTKI